MGIIDDLGLWDASTSYMKKAKVVTKTLVKRGPLVELQTRLCTLRDQVSAHLLVLIMQQLSTISQSVHRLSSSVTDSQRDMTSNLKQALREIRRTAIPSAGTAGSEFGGSDVDDDEETSIYDNIKQHAEEMLRLLAEKEMRILETLHFSQLEGKEDSIPAAHGTTFEWILSENVENGNIDDTKPGFTEWLRHEDGVFWVTGKAGSGKSTLMKFLTHHDTTRRLLKDWAKDDQIIIARHFFLSSGTEIQKSQIGLLRALLLQILKDMPKLIPIACPDRWNARYSHSFDPWTWAQLIDAFENLGREESGGWKICLFIDGLDEYDGDHAELVKVILRLERLPRVKICASSRPWLDFSDAFAHRRWKIYLHDFTHADIRAFVMDTLSENERFNELQERDGPGAESLALEITDRAQGVFLWVFLVVRSLLRGLRRADEMHDLQSRMREVPVDLKEMFDGILKSIEDIYRVRTARVFLTMAYAATTFPVVAFYFMEFEGRPLPKEPLPFLKKWPDADLEQARALGTKKRQLIGQCGDLIFITRVPSGAALFDERVGFLHRTVADYIQTRDIQAHLKQTAGDFDSDKILLDACVGQLRSLARLESLWWLRPAYQQWIVGALHYARRIEVLRGRAEVEALDDLEAIIMGAFGDKGFCCAFRTIFDREDVSSFMQLVCRCDLASYVCHKRAGLSESRLDAEVPGWRDRICIKRTSGFEMCGADESGHHFDDWRLRRELAALP